MGTPNPPWQWWVGQYFSYDFSHGVGQSAVALVRCDAEQGSAAAHFRVQKVSKGLPKGGNTGGKIEAKSLQEATCAEKAETVKIALAPLREH